MSKYNKFFKLVLLFFLAFSISCGKKEIQTSKKKIKIGVSISSYEDTYLDYFRKEIIDYSKKFPEIEIISLNARADVGKQFNDISQLIDMGVQSLIVVPVNFESTYPLSDLAKESGVNIIYSISKPNYLPEEACFVGSNNEEAGVLQMEYLAKLLKNKGDVVVLMGLLSMEDSIKRTEALLKVAKKYPEINIIKKQTANWSRIHAKLVVSKWLEEGIKFDAVASNNDDMAIGAIDALKDFNLLDKVIVCGVDGTPEGLRSIENGEMDFTLLQNAKKQAILSFDKAYKLANGESVKQVEYVEFEIITKKNYKKFL